MKKEFADVLLKYGTARIDIKNVGNTTNKINIIKNSDANIHIYQQEWFNNEEGTGTIIESVEGILDLEVECINSGTINLWFKGLNHSDANNNNIPIYIEYTNIEVNGNAILQENHITCHDKPFLFKKNVENKEILKIHIEWLPFNNYNNYQNTILTKEKQIESLREKLLLRERQLKSIPQLSATSLGRSVLNGKVIYRNWRGLNSERSVIDDLNGFCDNQIWFTHYLNNKFPDFDYKIHMFGVFNPHDNIAYPMEGKKVLYSSENLDYRFLEMGLHFDKYALDYVDLAMGYDFVDNAKYLRFPFWLMWHFPPDVTEEKIEKVVESWNSANYEKSENVAAIASHDLWGTRTMIDNDINKITNVSYAGKWKNNTSDLWNKFKNNKSEYLKQFKFNICPENLIVDAYVTEKIFDAFLCDCIPLYAGGGNYLEPKVINPKSIIMWEGEPQYTFDSNKYRVAYYGNYSHKSVKWISDDSRNNDSIELFKNLVNDEKTYKEFKDQDRVLNSSTKYIIKIFNELEKHFERLIYS